MLFKSASEVKKYLPQTAEFEFSQLESFIKNMAEPELIKAALGKDLFDELTTAYTDNVLPDKMAELLDMVRHPLANYAYLKYLPFAAVTFGRKGAFREESEHSKTPFEYQMVAIENACYEAAFNGIEALLLYLEENIDETLFASWKTSSAFTTFKECFISTASEFSTLYEIGKSRRTFLALRTIMKEIEETEIKGLLGEEFFTELQTQNTDPDPSAITEANAKVLKYVKRSLAHLTIAIAAVRLPVRISPEGLQLISTSDRMTLKVAAPADLDRVTVLIKSAEESGSKYLKELNDFIYANIADYETFSQSSTFINPETTDPFDQSENGVVMF